MTDISNLPALQEAATRAAAEGLPYAGSVTPRQAWQLVSQGLALLVDVRTAEERKFVGHVPGSAHVPWATGTALSRNPRFVRELNVGSVNVREVPGYRLELTPFGGIKDSGLGYKEGVLEAMKSFCNTKTYSLPW